MIIMVRLLFWNMRDQSLSYKNSLFKIFKDNVLLLPRFHIGGNLVY